MTGGAVLALPVAAVLALAGCARQAPQPPQAPASEIVVLAADPETGEVGRMTVRTQGGQVALDGRGASTRVGPGNTAPAPPAVMSDAEIQRLFGAALAMHPPAARRFELYFQTGTETLTAESRARVPEVLAAVTKRIAPDVSIIGHTDTTGTSRSNVELGLRRATLIRSLLVEAGLDPSLVETASHGETDLLVTTPDDTAEPRNRRVEVIVR